MESRITQIEDLSKDGHLEALRQILEPAGTQYEYDVALIVALAYSHLTIAEYLLSRGADISFANYDGVYWTVQNNELASLQFALSKGVDINFSNGILIKTAVEMTINEKDITLITWMLENGADAALLCSSSLNNIKQYGTAELKHLLERYRGSF